jgi:hypothetical protein
VGNELVDKLTKEAAVEDGPIAYDKIPRDTIITREKENGLRVWQQQWSNVGKGAVTTAFFPLERTRPQQKIPVFPEFTTMVTPSEYIEGAAPLRKYRENGLSNIRQNFIYKPVKIIQHTKYLRTPKKQATVKPSTTIKRVNTKRFTQR